LRDHSLALLHVNLVAEDDKGEVFGVMWGGLNKIGDQLCAKIR
jgi:hypothetical protein